MNEIPSRLLAAADTSSLWRHELMPPLRHQPRVLLGEDDSDLRASLARVLERVGLCVTAVGSGRELLCAIDRAATGGERPCFDLLVTDVRMPFCNGLTVLSLMERELIGVPCIVVSAFGDEALRAQAERLGATFMRKPIDADELARRAARALGEREGPRR